jgi:hypothetical protein
MSTRLQQKQQPFPDLRVTLYELLQGKRNMLRVYSELLQDELCFVNAESLPPEDLARLDCPVYTTRELAHILSLSDEEFRRFHYLKTRLVG